MKKVITLLGFIAVFSASYSSNNSISVSVPAAEPPVKATEVYIPIGNTGQLISLMELSQIKVKDLEKMTGKKMSRFDKMNFKIGQQQLRKNINEDGSFSKERVEKYFTKAAINGEPAIAGVGGISWGGLALGLFLSLIGVLIAYLISGDNKASRIKWAWIGAIISLIIWGAVII